MKRKIVAIFLGVGVASAIGLSVFAMQNKNNKIIISTTGIEEKREDINNNPYIPQEKKDLINSKLDIKENIIEQTPTNSTASNYITKNEAKAIALQHAGLTELEVQFVNGYLSDDDGRAQYEIEFWKDNTEYDYEIDAITGNILDYDYDIETYSILNENGKVEPITEIEEKREHINSNPHIPQEKKELINNKLDIKENIIQQTDTDNTTTNYITESKAKAIALEHAQLKESEVGIKKVELDYDDDRAEYEIEFHQGRTEYEYTIDAATGKILDYNMDYDD